LNLKRAIRKLIEDNVIIPIWLATGFYLNQFLHTTAYSNSNIIWGLFGFEFPLSYSYFFSLIIWLISYILTRVFIKIAIVHPLVVIPIFCFIEFFSQIFSRGLMKLGFDGMLFLIFYYRLFIKNKYNREKIRSVSNNTLKLLHNEVLGILRISVNILISIMGVLAITFAIQFIPKIYQIKTPNIMAWYGTIVIYIFAGLYFLICNFLFRMTVFIRETFAEKEKTQIL